MDERELIKRCLSNDKQAWDEFVARYSRLIYNYIYAVLNVKGHTPANDIASDICQGVFLSLCDKSFKKLRNFQGRNKCSLPSYLRIITINFTLDYFRRNSRQLLSLDEEREEGEGASLKDIIADGKPGADEAVSNSEKYQELVDCIKQLEIKDKYFVQMHIYQGLDIKELSRLFKASRGSLDMRKTRILKKLKDCFRRKKFMLDF